MDIRILTTRITAVLTLALVVGAAAPSAADVPFYVETVQSDLNSGKFVSMAIDVNGDLHVAYYGDANNHLYYARRTNGVWSYEPVDQGGDMGQYCSIAIDSNNLPHICYLDATNDEVKYARLDEGVWTIEVIPDGLESGFADISFALDDLDRALEIDPYAEDVQNLREMVLDHM